MHSCWDDRSFKNDFPFHCQIIMFEKPFYSVFSKHRFYFDAATLLQASLFCVLIQDACFGDLCTAFLSQVDGTVLSKQTVPEIKRDANPKLSLILRPAVMKISRRCHSVAMLRYCRECFKQGKIIDLHSELYFSLRQQPSCVFSRI